MWQYSSKGSVPGIQGEVDMNLYFGALEGGERPKLPNGQEAPLDPGINRRPAGPTDIERKRAVRPTGRTA